MHYENIFELIISVLFSIIPQIGGLGPKYQDFVIPFRLGEGEPLPYFHLVSLAIRSELVLTIYQTVQVNKITGKYIMEL